METPDTQTEIYDFGDYSVEWEHAVGISQGPFGGRDHGVAFVGETGTMVVDRGQWRVSPEMSGGQAMIPSILVTQASANGLDRHAADFIACMKDRSRTTACPIASAANTATVCQMGNVAWRTGRKVHGDAAAGEFKGNAEANALMAPRYRAPYPLADVSRVAVGTGTARPGAAPWAGGLQAAGQEFSKTGYRTAAAWIRTTPPWSVAIDSRVSETLDRLLFRQDPRCAG